MPAAQEDFPPLPAKISRAVGMSKKERAPQTGSGSLWRHQSARFFWRSTSVTMTHMAAVVGATAACVVIECMVWRYSRFRASRASTLRCLLL